MRVFIIDTNVVVAGLISSAKPESPVTAVLDGMLAGRLVYVLSPALLDEYRAVLRRPRLMKLHRLAGTAIDDMLVELTANAIWREPAAAPSAPDRGDNHLWALLSDYPGGILVTGDHLLLTNPPPTHVVVSPAHALQRLRSAPS